VTGNLRHLLIGKIHQLPPVAGKRQEGLFLQTSPQCLPGIMNAVCRAKRGGQRKRRTMAFPSSNIPLVVVEPESIPIVNVTLTP
jgi:hypothetical protein